MKNIKLFFISLLLIPALCACSYFEPYSSKDELKEVMSDYGYDTVEDYVRSHYYISDIWDYWDIKDFVREHYDFVDIWDEDEIKEYLLDTGLIEEWYEEYCSDDYDYYRN